MHLIPLAVIMTLEGPPFLFTAVCIKFRNLITAQFILLLNSNNSEKPFVVNEILDTGIIFRNLHLLSLRLPFFFFTVSGVTINVESRDLC